MKDFLTLAKERYSVRDFDGKKAIPAKDLDYILSACSAAPTAKNAQSVRVLLIQSKEAIQKAIAASPCVYGANTVLVFGYENDKNYVNRFESSLQCGPVDCSILATHATLAAAERGLGSCIVANFDPNALRASLNLPTDYVPILMLPIGYPSEKGTPADRHFSRIPKEELVLTF